MVVELQSAPLDKGLAKGVGGRLNPTDLEQPKHIQPLNCYGNATASPEQTGRAL